MSARLYPTDFLSHVDTPENDFLRAVSAVWRHIEQECDYAPGKGFIRLRECTDPALHTHLLEQEGEAWKRYRSRIG